MYKPGLHVEVNVSSDGDNRPHPQSNLSDGGRDSLEKKLVICANGGKKAENDDVSCVGQNKPSETSENEAMDLSISAVLSGSGEQREKTIPPTIGTKRDVDQRDTGMLSSNRRSKRMKLSKYVLKLYVHVHAVST